MTIIRDNINIDIQESQIDLDIGVDKVNISIVSQSIPAALIPDPLTLRLDTIDDTLMYRGDAAIGSLESDSVWQIKKIITLPDGDVSIIFVNADGSFIYVWDDRLSYIYS